ncbi:acetate kinase [Methylopila jiangsuensis]|uniref:Acetate kinase n=1 Tax=Methylopila jiangsuensis TaxID=586230 RepID=A0A9W6JBZ5_9HYPH|nr:acetate/propionate family kinase [Methylopila jiangsuensis]MDR6287266.1 acetate kinase [Methylopila jiangsuensis]GLK74775.1 acetate kinase [Methylopila jiangsuensis]
MIDTLLVLNSGSSSLKFQVFSVDGLEMLARGKAVRLGEAAPVMDAEVVGGASEHVELAPGADHEVALSAALAFVDRRDAAWRMRAVAHRVVHGGDRFVDPVIVTPDVFDALEKLSPLAPLHQPHNLAAVSAAQRLLGDVVSVACFDTAFHARREPLFHDFALPRDLRERGVRRYGFHGLSYHWVERTLAADHPALHAGRVVAAHLGNGASLCAMAAGRSVDTTMGMTALDGLPMGTRCGALDAGAVLYLLQALGMSAEEVSSALYERSGLLGLSELSNDVETLLASTDPRARFALAFFEMRVAQFAAAMAAAMGGIDALVFTGGIGEHAAPVRRAIVERLRFLGPFEALVVKANEERVMAVEATELLARTGVLG